MKQYKSNASLRAFYVFAATTIWLGIWLTGVSEASWVFYIPGVTFVFAAITGFCPSLIAFRKVLNQ